MDSFVISTHSVDSDDDRFGASAGPVSYLRVKPGDTEPRPSHAIGDCTRWINMVVAQATPQRNRGRQLDIVFFVHGYNTSPGEGLTRQRLVERNLRERDCPCLVIGFDWPTAGSAALYAYDRFQAQAAAANLVTGAILPFMNYTDPSCTINVHVLAHSMGGFVVREAFRAVDKGRNANIANDWRIGQMVLFAADLSSSCFALDSPDMVPVFRHCGRLTNYYSGYDDALAVSSVKNIDISSRVGRVGMPEDTPAHEKALDVDCGPRYAAVPDRHFSVIDGMQSHSWYLEDDIWYDDLAHTLAGRLDRNLIPTRQGLGQRNDFRLNSA